ncbi:hypothetical protein D3C81_1571080 [compost metagenome]
MNFVLSLEEDSAQHAWLITQFVQRGKVMRLQWLAHFGRQAGPVVALRNVGVAVVWLLRIFVREFQEQQISELFQIIAIAHAIVAQGVAEIPDFLDKGTCIHSGL